MSNKQQNFQPHNSSQLQQQTFIKIELTLMTVKKKFSHEEIKSKVGSERRKKVSKILSTKISNLQYHLLCLLSKLP